VPSPVPRAWDSQADVVVVGFGAAGACAALEAAAAGCDVVVLDRFAGGGASYVSGLSLADCVFSGRRAGRHAAAAVPVASADGPGPTADQRR
jgi:succinate dehydrogenase/fumarate reductase flavoprotein subunit